MERQEWEKAIAGFEACLVKNKRHPQSYGNLGICYGQIGQRDKAFAAFDKALEIDPSYEPALHNRAIFKSLKEGQQVDFTSEDYYRDRILRDNK